MRYLRFQCFCAVLFSATILTGQEGQSSKVTPVVVDISTLLMQSTFRIEGPARNEPGKTSTGTIFVVGRPLKTEPDRSAYVLVTAAHVLDSIGGQTASLLIRRKNDDETYTPQSWPISIRSPDGKDLFVKHKDADVAAMYVPLPNDLNIGSNLVPTQYFADDKMLLEYEVHPGDELLCLGFPFGLTVNEWGFPILRTGVISSFPLTPAKAVKFIGFDFRVFGGNSGGPVYFRFSNRYYQGTTHLGAIVQSIIGLVTEQVSDPASKTPISLARIVPAQFIVETIDMLPEYTGK
jgi:S1-C subfamily serine protease